MRHFRGNITLRHGYRIMGKEIEHKYLVKDESWRQYVVSSDKFIQAYISHRKDGIVRLRISEHKAYITIKGRTVDCERGEWEYEIPVTDAQEMMAHKVYEGGYLEKRRYYVIYEGFKWEIDVFEGRHKGLILAEIELPDKQTEFIIPPFIGEEVSQDPQYFNSNLNKL